MVESEIEWGSLWFSRHCIRKNIYTDKWKTKFRKSTKYSKKRSWEIRELGKTHFEWFSSQAWRWRKVKVLGIVVHTHESSTQGVEEDSLSQVQHQSAWQEDLCVKQKKCHMIQNKNIPTPKSGIYKLKNLLEPQTSLTWGFKTITTTMKQKQNQRTPNQKIPEVG